MKGWLFTGTHIPLKLVEKPDPVAKAGEVVVDIKASGLCHSDVGALEGPGWMDLITAAPLIMGHECAGIISQIGEGVEGFENGQRVGVCPISPSTWTAIGYARDGGYADKVVVAADQLVPMPEEVTFAQGAAATDAGMTSYHAMFVTGAAKPGMKVGVIGIGGLGQIAAKSAVVKGIEVYAVDTSPAARDLARQIGCKEVYEKISDLEQHQLPLIVDYAGFGTTTAEALNAIGFQGTIVVVGMGRLETTINTRTLILKQAKILGSNGGYPSDIAAVYELMASGDIDPLLTTITFDEIPEGLERLRKGEVKGRLVALPD